MWLREVEHETVSKLDLILSVVTNAEQKIGIDGVKSNQNGGMRCHFTDFAKTLDLKAYWKPCTDSHLPSNTETFQSEVIAFYVDQILAFHRTPVVVPRYFNYSQLLSLGYEALVLLLFSIYFLIFIFIILIIIFIYQKILKIILIIMRFDILFNHIKTRINWMTKRY